MAVKLPDVSEFQSPASGNAPDWAGIKSQNGGAAIIRVGYGNAHRDGMFRSNRARIKSLKFGFCGLYQYLRAGQDVLSQARAFISWIGPDLNEGEIPILDLEGGSGNQSGRANQWFGIIDDAYDLISLPLSQRSWLYSGQNFAVSAGLAPIFNSARRTWIAAYRASEAGLLPHTLWQSTDGQTGANRTNWSGCGFCDTSIYHGTLASLSDLGWHPPAHPRLPLPEEEMQIPNEQLQRHLVPAARRPEQLGDDRLQPGHLILVNGLPETGGASWPLRRDRQGAAPSPRRRCCWPGGPGSTYRRSWSTGRDD
jgi:hypothetical protein